MSSQVMVYEVMCMRVVFDAASSTWLDSPPQLYPGPPCASELGAYRMAGELNMKDMLQARYELERLGIAVYDLACFNYYYVRPRPASGRELAWMLRSVFIDLVTRSK